MTADVKIYFIAPDNTQTEITGRVDGLDKLDVTLRDDLTKSFTSELEFYDDGYNILKFWLLTDSNAFINEVKVKIYDTCCNTLVIDGVIRATTIDWCEPICSIKANIVEGKEAFDCLKSTLIWDNTTEDESGLTFLQREQKRLRYCVDLSPTGLLIILLVFYVIFSLILNVLGLILTFFAGLAFLLSFGFLDFQDTLDQLTGWIDELQERMIICNWYHPTALVRDYIENACQKCGLTFQSSILKNPGSVYNNTLLFSAQIRKGYKPSKTAGNLIEQNLPTETIETLMDSYLKPLFNAQYWVIGNTLIFERKDYFDNPTNVWIDAEQLLNDGLIEGERICFSYLDKERPSFADFKYAQDFADPIGNYAGQRFDKIVEWNQNPYSATQSGKYEPNIASSPARFRSDQIEDDTYEKLGTNPAFAAINLILGFNPQQSLGMLLLGDHVCANYKFLIWDESSGLEDSRIQGNYPDSTFGEFYDFKIDEDTGNLVPYYVPQDKRYNLPFIFRPNGFSQFAFRSTLYYFHSIENPRLPTSKNFNFEFTFNFNCTQYADFNFTKTVRLFKNGQIVYGKVKELSINFVSRTISVKGEV
jgi:hypothetical protein